MGIVAATVYAWADLASYIVAMAGGALIVGIVQTRMAEAEKHPSPEKGGKHAARKWTWTWR